MNFPIRLVLLTMLILWAILMAGSDSCCEEDCGENCNATPTPVSTPQAEDLSGIRYEPNPYLWGNETGFATSDDGITWQIIRKSNNTWYIFYSGHTEGNETCTEGNETCIKYVPIVVSDGDGGTSYIEPTPTPTPHDDALINVVDDISKILGINSTVFIIFVTIISIAVFAMGLCILIPIMADKRKQPASWEKDITDVYKAETQPKSVKNTKESNSTPLPKIDRGTL